MIENRLFTMFVIANIVQFMFGLVISAMSYSAYRSSGKKESFRIITFGFLCITIGGVLAPIYELGIKKDYYITGLELLKLQILEGTVIAVGLALLLLSVFKFNDSTRLITPEDIDAYQRGEEEL